MSKPLQNYSFDASEYERPNQKWVCGWAADGRPCRVGPDQKGQCLATTECVPMRKGDRWECARPLHAGGKCDAGPRPDGQCACPIQKCQPARGIRAKRGALVLWLLLVSFGIVVLGLGSTRNRNALMSPGSLSLKHGALGISCKRCHDAPVDDPLTWLQAVPNSWHNTSQSAKCLACHQLGPNAQMPHGRAAHELESQSLRMTGGHARAPFPLSLGALVPPVAADENGRLACAACHREHRGPTADLTQLSDAQCQSCHARQFKSFSDGHPDFDDYPYTRRTRIKFDHGSHGRHFADKGATDRYTCTACHQADVTGRHMLVKGFDTTCAECHTLDTRQNALAVIGVPGLDMDTLEHKATPVGHWPEHADGKITPILATLLSTDPQFRAASETLADADLLDLSDADENRIKAVEQFAWSVKKALSELALGGHDALRSRIEAAAGAGISDEAWADLSQPITADTLQSAVESWFPDLHEEVARHDAGQRIPIPGAKTPETAPPDPEPDAPETPTDATDDLLGGDDLLGDGDLLGSGDDDLLGGDDDLLGSDDDLLGDDDDLMGGGEDDLLGGDDDLLGDDDDLLSDAESPVESSETKSEIKVPDPLDPRKWASAGGFYESSFQLHYQPTGHADPFLRAWLDLTVRSIAAQSEMAHPLSDVFKALSERKAAGACGKCHTFDAYTDGYTDAYTDAATDTHPSANWISYRPQRDHHPFTRFSHESHFALLDDDGCYTCHKLNPKSKYAASFAGHDPTTQFQSNFLPLDRAVCAKCHLPDRAGDRCLTCHNYHVGVFGKSLTKAPVLIATKPTK